jgi:predicted kinase
MLTVVQGAPCSGKSTYVREHAAAGDIVIDFDVLAQALGSPDPHDHSTAIRMVAIDMRRTAISSAVQQHLAGATVWIVDINPGERMALYRRAGAKMVTLTASAAELHARATAERPPRWHELIDEHQAKAAAGTPVRRPRRGSGTC